MRFPHQFIDDVQALVLMLIKDIVERYIKVCNSETDEISSPVYRRCTGSCTDVDQRYCGEIYQGM